MSLSTGATWLYLLNLAISLVRMGPLKLATIVEVDGAAEGLDDDLASGGDPDLTGIV